MQYKTEEYDPIFHDKFKALSVKQPYAGMIASGEKTIEVRTKPTKYRGQLLICASKDGRNDGIPGYGCTLAFAELYDCKPLSELTPEEWGNTKLAETEAATAKEKGGFGWFLRDIRRVIEYPVKGQLGIYNLIYTKGVIIPYPRSLKNPIVK